MLIKVPIKRDFIEFYPLMSFHKHRTGNLFLHRTELNVKDKEIKRKKGK